MNLFQKALYHLINAFFVVIGLIPRRLTFLLADALGNISYLIDKRHRQIALYNLARAFVHEKGAREIKTIARSVFKNVARIPLERGGTLRMEKDKFTSY